MAQKSWKRTSSHQTFLQRKTCHWRDAMPARRETSSDALLKTSVTAASATRTPDSDENPKEESSRICRKPPGLAAMQNARCFNTSHCNLQPLIRKLEQNQRENSTTHSVLHNYPHVHPQYSWRRGSESNPRLGLGKPTFFTGSHGATKRGSQSGPHLSVSISVPMFLHEGKTIR